MTYETKKVESAIAFSDGWMRTWNDLDKTVSGRKVSGLNNALHYIDGIPVSKPVFTLASEIRKVNPTLKFCASIGYLYVTDSSVLSIDDRVFCRLYAYREDHDYVLGEIGHGDYHIRGSGEAKYMVASRKISHDKISHGHSQKHMALTQSLSGAVKNACKYLVPHTLEEVAALSVGSFTKALQAVRGDVINTARGFVDKCYSWRVIDIELRHLIRSGAQFITPEFQAAAAEFLRADSEATEIKQRKVCGQYVQFKEFMGVMRVNMLTFHADWSSDYYMGAAHSDQILASELSEELQGKIAILSMVEKGAHVPEVGMKVSDTAFWLERIVRGA